jgi:phosphonate transport system permease protein
MANLNAATNPSPTIATPDLRAIEQELRRPLPRLTLRLVILIIVILAAFYWGLIGTDARPETLAEGVPNIIDFISRLFPPQFEFEQGTERVYTLFPFTAKEPVALGASNRAQEAQPATPEDLAALTEGHTVAYLYRGDNRRYVYTEAQAVGTVEAVPFILPAGHSLFIDEQPSDPYILPEGTRFESRFIIGQDQALVGGRYLLDRGDILLGWPVVIPAIVETVQIALIGTVGAIVLSIPIGLLAARNVSPHPVVYQVTRIILNANRAIPELIFALIFVVAVGLGPFAGVMALVIGSIGSLGKLYAESIEAIDPQQVAAVRATGAPALHVFTFAVIPQAFPNMASYSLLLFEGNVRAATILGIVGAGGVGFIIQKYLALFQYQEMIGATLVIIVVVTLIDRASDYIRKSII